MKNQQNVALKRWILSQVFVPAANETNTSAESGHACVRTASLQQASFTARAEVTLDKKRQQ